MTPGAGDNGRLAVRFAAHGRHVEVLTPSALEGAIRGLFFPWARSPSPTDAPADARLSVLPTASGYVVDDGGPRISCADMIDVLARVEFAVTQGIVAGLHGWVRLHAAGASAGDRAVLALGPTGAGKSSLAVAWQRAGLASFGDDLILIGPDGLVHPFERLFKVAPHVLAELGVPLDHTPYWEPGSTEAWYDPVRDAGWAAPASAGVVAVVHHVADAPCTIEPMAKAEALSALLASRIPPLDDPADDVERLAKLVEGAESVRVVYGRAAEAAAALAQRAA